MSTSPLFAQPHRLNHHDAPEQQRRLRNSTMVSANALLTIGCGGVVLAVAAAPFGTTGMILGFVCLIVGQTLAACGGFARHIARKLQPDLDALESGEAVALHWTYTKEEWLAHVANERSEAGGQVLVGSLLFGFIALFVGYGIAKGGETLAASFNAFALTVAAGTAIGAIFGWLTELGLHWKCNRMQRRIGETYIGEQGLYFDGDYRRWEFQGSRLVSVDLLSDVSPLTIDFRFYISAGKQSRHQHVRVPVPAGEEDTAIEYVESIKSM